jgi:periodic tryptophan protein 2
MRSPSAEGLGEAVGRAIGRQVKLWDVFEARVLESLECNKDCLALAYRPDGDELCVSVLGGSLLLWNTKDGTLERAIEGAHDVSGKRQASP